MSYEVLLLSDGSITTERPRHIEADAIAVFRGKLSTLFKRKELRFLSRSVVEHDGVRAFTYEDKSAYIANITDGDFVPPGYECVSKPLVLSTSYANRRLSIPDWDPIKGFLINPSFSFSNRASTMYLRNFTTPYTDSILPHPHAIPGWSMCARSSTNLYTSTLRIGSAGDDKIINYTPLELVLYQKIKAHLLRDITSTRLRIPGCPAIVFNDTAVLPDEYGIFNYEVPPDVDVTINITVPAHGMIQNIEVL